MPNHPASNQASNPMKLFKAAILVCHFTLLVNVISCASTPPSETLPQSEVAASSIDHSNYRNFVNEDVENVLSKLKHAEDAAAENNHKLAEQLAQQILVDIELIKLKTQRLNVEQDVEKLESSITSLHQELQWREPVKLSPLDQ